MEALPVQPSKGLTLAPISADILLASLRQLADRSIDWQLQGEGTPQVGAELSDHRLSCARFSWTGSGSNFGMLHVVSPLLRPRMPYAIAAITCAMPMSPIMSSGETSRVNDLDRVSPTVILPRQSSVSSVGEPLE